MSKITFKKWIMQFIEEDNPHGDLARDINTDEGFPDTVDYDKIHSHLLIMGADLRAIEAFERAWEDYSN